MTFDEFIVCDGRAFHCATNEIAVDAPGEIPTVEPVGPFPEVARQMFGGDTMVGSNEPRFDVAEQDMDDGEESGGIGARSLDHWRMFQVVTKSGVTSLVAHEPVGQQMRLGRDVCLDEGSEFNAVGGRENGDPDTTGVKSVLTLYCVPVFSALVLRCRHLLDDRNNQAFIRVCRATTGTCGITPTTDERLVRFKKTGYRPIRVFAQSMAELVGHGPGRLVSHPQLSLKEFRRNAPFVTAHEMGCEEPLR